MKKINRFIKQVKNLMTEFRSLLIVLIGVLVSMQLLIEKIDQLKNLL